MPAHLVRLAWQRTLAALVINLMGMSAHVAMGLAIVGVLRWSSIGSLGISGILLLYLIRLRRQPSQRHMAAIFLVNNIGIVAALWVASGEYSQRLAWMPFQPNKLGALIVAVLGPEQLWVGFLSIGLFIGTALVKMWTLRAAPALAPLLALEVLTLFIFGSVGSVLLVYRARSDRLRDDLVQAQAKSQAFGAIAHRLLAISDLANTPLQILELDVRLLKEAEPRESVLRVERATANLRKCHQLLDREAVQLTSSAVTESFDAQAVLRDAVVVQKKESHPCRADGDGESR